MSSSSDTDISIMSYNVGKQAFPRDKEAYAQYNKEFTDFMSHPDKPDILCLQEAGWFRFYKDSLSYPHVQKAGTLAILSKHEIKDQGIINFEKSSNRLVWADIQVKDRILRVVNIHLQSNKISDQAEDLVNNADFKEKKTWLGIKSVIGKIKRATSMRTRQSIDTKKFINASPYPTIVLGDFNDTPLSYTYRHIAKGLKDAFKQKGNGIGITFAGVIPGLRIDYILGNKDIQFKRYHCPKVDYSDHYPIICHFDFKHTPK